MEKLQALSSLNQTNIHFSQQVTPQQNTTLHFSQQVIPQQKTFPLRIITVVVAVMTMSVVVCAGLFFRGFVLDNPTGEEHTPPKQERAY